MQTERQVKELLKEAKGFMKKTQRELIVCARKNDLTGIEEKAGDVAFFNGYLTALDQVLKKSY